ncbi:MAG: alpha-amylase [Calditrichaeota bacterium]|nr:MAG: alpha-amylase [Calditrichota bacterium]MBL1205651.1 alpha-amylase [Calditrichota bacterium]NOG45479.1 alpha-amylase [Calditrichota bacterium]
MIFTIGSKPVVTQNSSTPQFFFHVNKESRIKYSIDDALFSIKGRVVFANFNAVKALSEKINKQRDPEKTAAVSPSLLNAMGLMDEILHFMIESYKSKLNPTLLGNMLQRIQSSYGKKDQDLLLNKFADQFPNNDIFNKKISAAEYLQSKTHGVENSEIIIEELLVQWIQNQNKAYEPAKELINDAELKKTSISEDAFADMKLFFEDQPQLPGSETSFLETLMQPAKLFPGSIYDQLEFIKENWGADISQFVSRILISLDFFKEEAKKFIPETFGHETPIASFSDDVYEFEPEAFSADLDWMPHLVLIAKSTYVWLDQLSKQYKKSITRLDQIPDEELNRLANFGFTGLWLIGLWERSSASAKIKRINGNPEAVASAYSLKNYDIAEDIGGFSAYQDLKGRAAKRGIRLASDMVPNHMAIDSDWVSKHPHWFLQTDHPPFPNHTFNGPDLSDDESMSVYIEDGYWQQSDAGVSFKRVDKNTGQETFIYHGNDGTGMPWNDTAQLNFMLPEVREGVIQTILHVARMFPVIRFDAAMTLAKKHYQRLWFPEPGTGGDIPTRAEYAMTKAQFNEIFPEEFWREVVDRVQQECPDTLLLAEAFWMMEGYFVRSLGMHRVYNSAFMNLLKDEENEKYRLMIQNVLEFNPQIMKRYVNFMNNPDEETAVAQFGKEDKYFGVCMLMCTMPGLPMFGHGQIEGFQEKYGMEYKKAYWDESIDDDLVNRHRREIFPILKKRKLFSEVDNFHLYNFVVGNSHVNENVYVFSNMYNGERSLVLFNNAYQETAGMFNFSVNYKDQSGNLKSESLANALKLSHEDSVYTILKEHISGLEYLRKNSEIIEKGLFAELGGYKYQVFLEIEEVYSDLENPYGLLNEKLNGAGVTSIKERLHEFKIEPVTQQLIEFYSNRKKCIDSILNGYSKKKTDSIFKSLNSSKKEIYNFIELAKVGFENKQLHTNLENLAWLPDFLYENSLNKKTDLFIKEHFKDDRIKLKLNWFFTIYLNRYLLDSIDEIERPEYYKYWLLEKTLNKQNTFTDDELVMIKLLSCYDNITTFLPETVFKPEERKIFENPDLRKFLKINTFEEITYFNKEQWEVFVDMLAGFSIMEFFTIKPGKSQKTKTVNRLLKRVELLKKASLKTGFELNKMIILLTSSK